MKNLKLAAVFFAVSVVSAFAAHYAPPGLSSAHETCGQTPSGCSSFELLFGLTELAAFFFSVVHVILHIRDQA